MISSRIVYDASDVTNKPVMDFIIHYNKNKTKPTLMYDTLNDKDLLQVARLERYILRSDPEFMHPIPSSMDEFMYALIDKFRLTGGTIIHCNYEQSKRIFTDNVLRYYAYTARCTCGTLNHHDRGCPIDSLTIRLKIEYGYTISNRSIRRSNLINMTESRDFEISTRYLHLYASELCDVIDTIREYILKYPHEIFIDNLTSYYYYIINDLNYDISHIGPTIKLAVICNSYRFSTYEKLKNIWSYGNTNLMVLISVINHIINPSIARLVASEYHKSRSFHNMKSQVIDNSKFRHDCIFEF